MKTVTVLPLLLLLGSFCYLEAAHILCLVSSAKHNNPGWSRPLFDALLAKGHQLTVLSTSEPGEVPEEGMVYYHLPNEYDVMRKHFIDKKSGEYQPMVALKQLLVWYEVILGSCSSMLESATLKRLLPELVAQVGQEFELIITDITEGANCLLDMVPSLDAVPILGLSAGKLTPDLMSLLQAENTISAARTPHHLSQVSRNMGFWNRLHNHIMYFGESLINWLIIRPVLSKMMSTHKIFPKLQLVLLNTHPVVDYIQNLPPRVIEVGGLHIKDEAKDLPAYIERFMDKFIYGIVYINMPDIESIQQGIEAVVDMIHDNPNYGFIWNVNDMKVLPAQMPNLLTLHVDQSPQQDILGKNFNNHSLYYNILIMNWNLVLLSAVSAVKGFLNHGDSFSIQEAVYYGVPMVVLPLNLEQFNTAQRVQERQLGVMVSSNQFHLKTLSDALHSILDVDHFTTILYSAQHKFRTRLQSPIEIAVWHAEQMIADPQFFKDMETIDQNFFVARSLDVLAVPLVLFLIFAFNLFHVISIIVKGPKKELKKRRKTKKAVEEVEPGNKSLLEHSTELIDDLKDEMIEGEMELLAANQSHIPNKLDE
ncbi:hypothetical protein KR038_012107, partial [Drosophila bunnanda]